VPQVEEILMIGVIRRSAAACLLLTAALLPHEVLAADRVKVGTVASTGEFILNVAQGKGYFEQEGIEPEYTFFDSAAKAIAPLGTGQIDVAGGAVSSGLFNAVERDIAIRIVADRTSVAPGFGFHGIVVRKDLADTGAVKSIANLKGRKIAIVARGSSTESILNEAMKSVGLRYDDVEVVYLAFPQQAAALSSGAVDAVIATEPYLTPMIKQNFGKLLASTDTFYPNAQIGELIFSEKFASTRKDVGVRFVKAYIRAIRDFRAALGPEGRLDGPGSDEIVALIMKHSGTKDEGLLRSIKLPAVNIDGRVNRDSIQKDWQFFKDKGMIGGAVTPDKIIDASFVEEALKQLGPAKAP
jgi:NitT/TauT family transport system substrate-binding protein